MQLRRAGQQGPTIIIFFSGLVFPYFSLLWFCITFDFILCNSDFNFILCYNLLLCFIPLEMHVRLICAIKYYLLTYLRTLTAALKRLIKQLLDAYSTTQVKYYKQTRKLEKINRRQYLPRGTMQARYLAVARCLWLSFSASVISRNCIKTAERIELVFGRAILRLIIGYTMF